MSRRLLVTLGLAGALLTGAAAAQQPPPPGGPAVPPGHPPIRPLEQTTPDRPGAAPMPPPQRAPGVQPGRPIGPGGQQLPPGAGPGRTIPLPGPGGRGAAPTPPPAPAPRLEECPGHGPMDPPHHVNWFHGLLGVNNEKAEQGGINSLLWRYHNKTNPCDPKNEPPPYLAQVINLGVFAFIIYRMGRKPLVDGLAKRRQGIMQEIDTANRLKSDSERRLKEYERKLGRLEETREEIKAEYAAQAEVDRKALLAELEERRAWMRRDAEFRVEQELKAARALLLQEAVRGAVTSAEQIIQREVTRADQDRLADEYLSSIQASFGAQPLIGSAGSAGAPAGGAQSTGAST